MSHSGSRSGVWVAGPGPRPWNERQGQSSSERRQQRVLPSECGYSGILSVVHQPGFSVSLFVACFLPKRRALSEY